jgi:hypothetical protein
MSKLARRMRQASQKAAQISQAVQAAPQQAAKLRETVLATASQLHDLRNEVQACFAGVSVDTDERLVQVVAEVNDNITVLESAGYELIGADIEVLPLRKVILKLDRFEQVSVSTIRSLTAKNATRRTIQALLSAIVKAEEMSAEMEFSGLEYRGIVVNLGTIATVRVCWSLVEEEEAEVAPPVMGVASIAPATAPTTSSLPTFGAGGFFQPRASAPVQPATPAASASSQPASLPEQAASATHAQAAAEPTGDWRQTALDRFKKMPTGSKYKKS